MSSKRVIVVGGGYAGKNVANLLIEKNFDVTLIDNKDYFHHCVASVRSVVLPGFVNKVAIPYKPTFGDHFKQGHVESIDAQSNQVTLKTGEKLTYDYLVLATGSLNQLKETEGNLKDILVKHARICDELKKSSNVVILGAGAVGVEIAGEVKTEFPEKNVTLIGDNLVLPKGPEKFTARVKEILDELKVNTILGDHVSNLSDLQFVTHGEYRVKTESGREVSADFIFKCFGQKINSGAYAQSLAKHMESNGCLRVNEFLQVEGCNNIFAVGDCADIKAIKLAYIAGMTGELAAKNIIELHDNQPMTEWSPYSVYFLIGLAIGRNHGIGALTNGELVPDQNIIDMKSKDLMTGRFFKEMGQPIPD